MADRGSGGARRSAPLKLKLWILALVLIWVCAGIAVATGTAPGWRIVFFWAGFYSAWKAALIWRERDGAESDSSDEPPSQDPES